MSDETKGTEKPGPTGMGMGMGMAKKMMEQMGKGGPSPMAMMQKMMAQMGEAQEGGQKMPPMMQMCMGMCAEMLSAIKQTTEMAAFATPELHALFGEWMVILEDEAVRHLKENGETDAAGLAKALNISERSAAFLIARMAASGKARSHVRVGAEAG